MILTVGSAGKRYKCQARSGESYRGWSSACEGGQMGKHIFQYVYVRSVVRCEFLAIESVIHESTKLKHMNDCTRWIEERSIFSGLVKSSPKLISA